jgi:CRISPR-associated protein Cmr3
MSATSPHRPALVPRDGFFVKDGRGWSTSARTHVLDWPWPTTIRGALTTVSGKLIEVRQGRRFEPGDWKQHHAGVRLGRLVALRRTLPDEQWLRMWPVPADALWVEGQASVLRLKPKPPETPTLGRDAPDRMPQGYAEAREALWVAKVEIDAKPLGHPRWWEDATLTKWLCAEDVEAATKDQSPRMASRLQVHVGIRPDSLTGDDGTLFAHEVVETLERRTLRDGAKEIAEWAIGAEVTWPVDALPEGRQARLGSDSRIAWIERVSDDIFSIPQQIEKAFAQCSQGLRLMVVTPACFDKGWLPDGFEPVKIGDEWEFRGKLPHLDYALVLRAAFVPRPMHISGWDMANAKEKGGAPRSTSRLVPPGAVYFFQRTDKDAEFTANDARALWLAPRGRQALSPGPRHRC